MLTTGKDLKAIRDEIIDYAKKEGLVVYYSKYPPSVRKRICDWAKEDWKEYIDICKKAGAGILYCYEKVFEESEIAIKDGHELDEEIKKKIDANLTRLREHIGEIMLLLFFWVREGIWHVFEAHPEWAEDYYLIAQYHGEKKDEEDQSILEWALVPKELKDKTVEELTLEFKTHVENQTPDDSDHESMLKDDFNDFLESKGFTYSYNNEEINNKINEVLKKVEAEIQKVKAQEFLESEVKERKSLDTLVEECVDWAQANGLYDLKKVNLKAFLSEKGVVLTKNNEDILLSKAKEVLRTLKYEKRLRR